MYFMIFFNGGVFCYVTRPNSYFKVKFLLTYRICFYKGDHVNKNVIYLALGILLLYFHFI